MSAVSTHGFVENAAPNIKNIETINNATFAGATASTTANLDLAHVSGVKEIWTDLSGATPSGAPAAHYRMNYNNAGLENVYGVSGWKNQAGENEIDVSIHTTDATTAGDNDTLKVALKDTQAGDFIHVVARNGGVEHVKVDIANGSATLGLGGNAADIESITITGAGDLTISPKTGSAGNSFALFDASKATGDITWKPENGILTKDITILGGSGDDAFVTGTGKNTIKGGDGTDTINATAANSLKSGDSIDGGDGIDTLTISAGAAASGAAPTLANVEIINNYNVSSLNPVLNLSAASGIQELWTDFRGATGANYAAYENGSLDTIYGIRGASGGDMAINLEFDATAITADSTLKLALHNEGAAPIAGHKFGTTGTVYGVQALDADLKKVTVDVEAGNKGSLNLHSPQLETISVTGAGDVTIGSLSGMPLVTSFDANASSGSVNFISSALTHDFSAIGGSGNNVLNFSAATATANGIINGGAGNDIIIGGAGNDRIDGGAGNDIIWGDNPNNITKDPGIFGDDTINGGAGTNVIVLSTKDSNIRLGGQDTVIHDVADGGKNVVFNFNFGPKDRWDNISTGTADVDPEHVGADKIFDIIQVVNTLLVGSKIFLGQSNSSYESLVAEVQPGATPSGNEVSIAGNDVYTGNTNEFELVVKFTNGSEIVFGHFEIPRH